MLKIEKTEVNGFESAIRGMRNAKLSWDKSDSYWTDVTDCEVPITVRHEFFVGDNDLKLMKTLANAGPDHGKFLRYIDVTCDIVAPDYWFKEFSTYKVGTVENSTSTMHKIAYKEFQIGDFSWEHLDFRGIRTLNTTINSLNKYRDDYLETKSKDAWWNMIQLLPMSYNYRRTVHLNYAVLRNMYHARKNHKLDEWHLFCGWVESLPYAKELIVGE